MKTSVLLVDDHAVVREGLASLLSTTQDFEIVGEAAEGAAAIALAGDFHPDLIVIDLLMPGTDVVASIRSLKAVCPGSHITVLTSTEDDELAFSAIEAGAQSFLVKSMSGDALLDALRQIAAGNPVIHSSVAHRLLRAVRVARHVEPDVFASLTERELDVLRSLAEGASNARIAASLSIGESTVKTHIGNILSKLYLQDRTEAVAFAWRHGLVTRGASR
jgi:two-component system, NarL family, response regulator LiaR